MDHSLKYTPERAAELRSNLADVVAEIDGAKPAGASVSLLTPLAPAPDPDSPS